MSRAKELVEKLVDFKKINLDDLPTYARNALAFLNNQKFKVSYDPDTGKGEASRNGISFKFSTGSESFHFDLGELFVKTNKKEAVDKIRGLLDLVSSHGGQSK